MGILNVTPDSFSDGGETVDTESIKKAVLAMENAGVDIIDVGGESTRPGAEPVPEQVELERVVPAIETVRSVTQVCISIDTTKASVAQAALDAGAHMINDVSGGRNDQAMLPLAFQRGVPVRRTDRTASQGRLDRRIHSSTYSLSYRLF